MHAFSSVFRGARAAHAHRDERNAREQQKKGAEVLCRDR